MSVFEFESKVARESVLIFSLASVTRQLPAHYSRDSRLTHVAYGPFPVGTLDPLLLLDEQASP